MQHNRCPNRMAEGFADFMRSYIDYTERGMLPASGGMRDQASWWVRAVRLVDHERGQLEREKSRKLSLHRQAAASRGSHGG